MEGAPNTGPVLRDENAIEKIITHEGRFHTDEVFATAILKDLFPEKMELSEGGQIDYVKYIRNRYPDAKLRDKTSAMLLDTGTDYDFEKFNMDHHQTEGAGARENGVEYAAAGLVWKHFGKEWITYMDVYNRKMGLTEEEKDIVWNMIDTRYVQLIDARDTGQLEEISCELSDGTEINGADFTLAELVRLYNVDVGDGKKQNEKFDEIVALFREFTLRMVHKYMDLIEGLRTFNPELVQFSKDQKTVVINQVLPPSVNSYLMEHDERFKDVEFFAALNSKNGYSVMAVPIEDGLRKYRNPDMIPEELRLGNNGPAIDAVLGLQNGITFIHKQGFLASCKNEEAAKRLLDYCIEHE